MTPLQAIVLGLLQGATEFLPISSSGHLVLVPWLLGWNASGLTFDTTVHLGTLVAVVVYFWRDIEQIVVGVLKTLRDRNLDDFYGRLGWLIVVGSIPAAVAGALLESFFERLFGTPALVSIFLLVTGLILLLSERVARRTRELETIGWRDSVLIGLAQAAAIAPGISRSGSTIAAGLALGIRREAAARFSFLLALPVIFGAGMLKLKDAIAVGVSGDEVTLLVLGFGAAAVSGYACIHFLLRYVRRRSLYLFTAYCWAFGLFGLVVALVRG
ncbi:MAG: undecaprenyl-diphosphatase UppP [Caldilineae bacterium]|nr:MAG: undecaprenyl-diphosphatase UppP [Caldilineae bacterium]